MVSDLLDARLVKHRRWTASLLAICQMANLPAAPVAASTFVEFTGILIAALTVRYLPVTERPDTDNKECNTSPVDTLVWFHSIS